jgi:hypothetical protein
MKLPKLEELNNERFLDEAFNADSNVKWERAARLRRNIYLWFFLTGIACVFITALTGQMVMGILSLLLATLSLVVMTKYDTQLLFLTKLKLREPETMDEGEKR